MAAHLLYRGIEENGAVKIASLQAYWDFTGNALKLLTTNGLKGILASNVQFGNMIRIQGLKRVFEYCGAMYKGIFKKGFAAVNAFSAAVNVKDATGLTAIIEPHATIELPDGKATPIRDFLQGEGHDMQLSVSGLRSAGWYTSCVIDAEFGTLHRHGIAFFQFNPLSKKIIATRFFWNT